MQSQRSGRRFRTAQGLGLCVLLAVALTARTSCAATRLVTEDDRGGDIQIKVGDALEVHLQSNRSTGTMWYVHPKSTALLRLSGQKEIAATEPGAPSVQVFTFQSHRKGDGILLLRNARPGQRPVLGEEEFSLHVVIE
jgi:predicted secreted protein